LPVSRDATRDIRENGSSKPETAPSLSAIEGSSRGYETDHKPHGNADIADLADSAGGYTAELLELVDSTQREAVAELLAVAQQEWEREEVAQQVIEEARVAAEMVREHESDG
jgi:hypothetical protein